MTRRHQSELQRILTEKQLKTAAVAHAIGLSVRSIHNVSCGSSKSRAARKKIQQFVQTQIWKDIPFTPEARLRFSLGDFFVFPTPAMAAEFASKLGTAGETIGRHVRIRVPVDMIFTTDGGVSDAGAVMFAHDDGSENAIEIYCGQVPPDSPFSTHATGDDRRAKQDPNK